MAKEKFIDRNFSAGSLDIIAKANAILREYEQQNLVLTLPQLYYQFVSRDFIKNKQTEYKRLGSIINDARLAGLIDWSMMEDRTRSVRSVNVWESPQSITAAVAAQYKEDLWRHQPRRPEVWIEKDALVGVIENVCRELRLSYFACRGYASQSAQYEAGQRFRDYKRNKQRPVILHLGDHDPSGMDMTRDNHERVSMFSIYDVEVRRLALNMDQVEQYDPPPNPAKETDSRAADYMAKFGDSSWELDALEPSVIVQLIRDQVDELRVDHLWERDKTEEETQRETLQAISDRWSDVQDFLNDDDKNRDE